MGEIRARNRKIDPSRVFAESKSEKSFIRLVGCAGCLFLLVVLDWKHLQDQEVSMDIDLAIILILIIFALGAMVVASL